jgi:hypothetical protein
LRRKNEYQTEKWYQAVMNILMMNLKKQAKKLTGWLREKYERTYFRMSRRNR